MSITNFICSPNRNSNDKYVRLDTSQFEMSLRKSMQLPILPYRSFHRVGTFHRMGTFTRLPQCITM